MKYQRVGSLFYREFKQPLIFDTYLENSVFSLEKSINIESNNK